MKLFDAHAQLQFPQYDEDRDQVLARMREMEMGALIIGTDFAMSKAGIALARQHDFLWATVGIHPNDPVKDSTSHGAGEWVEELEELAKDPKVVAIGECGLDYFRSEKSEGQKEKFIAHLQLAEKLQKPVIVHCRNAHDDMLAILKEHKPSVPIVAHFFTASGEVAQKYLDLGCYLSFPGPVTYTDMYDDSIRICPMDKLLVETDAPFAAPAPYRGKRNEPSYVVEVAKKVADIKRISLEEVERHVFENATRIFKLQG